MGKKFPDASHKDIVKVAKKLGFYFCRRAKGSHEIWRRDVDGRQTTIPRHGSKSIKRKTLKSIFNDLDVKWEECLKLK